MTDVYQVEKIIGKRIRCGKKEYKAFRAFKAKSQRK